MLFYTDRIHEANSHSGCTMVTAS